MTTIRKSSRSKVATSTAKAAPKATSNTPSASPTAPNGTGSTILVQPPPAGLVIPLPPDGYVATDGAQYRGILPKTTQFAVMGAAVTELQNWTSYAAQLGSLAPPLDVITQSFDAANQWSVMRVRTITWESYCLQQEGLAWVAVHTLMDKLQPAFELAVGSDPTVAMRFPSLAKLFNAQREIAQKGVSTKKANKKAIAEGKAPTKGAVGKKRQRAAEKAAYLTVSATPPPTATGTAAPASSAGAAVPVVTGTAASSVATNGAAHS